MPKFKIGDRVQITGNFDDTNDPGVINAERDGKFEVIWSGSEGFTYGHGHFWWEPHELRHIGETIEHEPLSAPIATPRTDSDEGMAGEDLLGSQREALDFIAGFHGCIHHALFETRHDETVVHPLAHRVLREVMCAAFGAGRSSAPAPATPPGVPDSLRALSEAIREYGKAEWDAGYATGRDGAGPNAAAVDRLSLTLRALEALITTHPAGQSTGQGADELEEEHAGLRETYARLSPAPDSPLTGPVGVPPGWALVPVNLTDRMLEDGGQCLPPTSTLSYCYACFREAWAAALAARPAAPEAQGAWQDISNLAEKERAVLGRWCRCGDNEDGSEFWYWQRGAGFFFEYDGARHWSLDSGTFEGAPFYGAQPTHFLSVPPPPARPAPPSSGQGGR